MEFKTRDPPARPVLAGRTWTATLRATIADDIIRGHLAPGMPLEEAEIARRFGVSRTPVREALRDLAASGLIETRSHRSALVARPSAERLRGMFEVMAELEALCAAAAAGQMTAAEREALRALHAGFGTLIQAGDPQAGHEANERFHTAIYAGSHNDYLAEITLATRERLSPFRRAQFRAEGQLALSHAEHGRVVDAILRRDGPAAAAGMRAHIAIVETAYGRYAGAL
ncbi:MAG: transcriptional regulator, GntR family [Belnapia sp.]|nr:transcriptional regulator, GntR family [Belnapia sp.]